MTKNTKGSIGVKTTGVRQTTPVLSSKNTAAVKPTTPYSLFQCSIQRAKNLLLIHGKAHGTLGKPSLALADAHRAAIMLSVSALDAFVRTFILKKIIEKVKDVGQNIPEALKKRINEVFSQDLMFDAARRNELSSRLDKAFKQEFEEESFQGVKKIEKALSLVGYDDVFHTIAINSSTNEDQLKGDLGRVTKRRHTIAHCGDYDLTQNPPVENKISKKDVEDCIKIVTLVASQIDKLK